MSRAALYFDNIEGEALESGMCDVIKTRLKRRDATRIRKGNQPANH